MLRTILVATLLFPLSASASLKVEAQNRLHLGTAWTPGSTQVQVGFDSRMSSSLFVDIGAFISPLGVKRPDSDNPWVLQQGIYVDPGIRIPHRNPGEFKWDIIVRGGFGPVWMADGNGQNRSQVVPALNGGTDLLFRYKDWGLRMEARMWYTKTTSAYEKTTVSMTRPQIGTSILYEF